MCFGGGDSTPPIMPSPAPAAAPAPVRAPDAAVQSARNEGLSQARARGGSNSTILTSGLLEGDPGNSKPKTIMGA